VETPDAMKTHVLLLSAVGLFPFSPAMAQVPNGGFENWTSVDGHFDPDGWIVTNDATAPLGVISGDQGTPGAVGSFYAKVTTYPVPGVGGIIPGALIAGDVASETPGFTYTERPEALNGSIQYSIQPGDQGTILVVLKLGSVAVGEGGLYLTGSHDGWMSFSIPVAYNDPTTYPDTAYITITSSASNGVAGSTISIDNLSFGALTGGGAGIQEQQASVGLHVFPTLTSDVLNVIAHQALAQVEVLDMTGRRLIRKATNSESIDLDVSGLHTGRYLVQVYLADGRRLVRSFVKQ
jgi:hypothetical protein